MDVRLATAYLVRIIYIGIIIIIIYTKVESIWLRQNDLHMKRQDIVASVAMCLSKDDARFPLISTSCS